MRSVLEKARHQSSRGVDDLECEIEGLNLILTDLRRFFREPHTAKDLTYMGEINNMLHVAKRHSPNSSQFGLFAASDLVSTDTCILGEYVGLVETETFMDAQNKRLSGLERQKNQYELRVLLPVTATSNRRLVITALQFCNEMAFINSHRDITEKPNARFLEVCTSKNMLGQSYCMCMLLPANLHKVFCLGVVQWLASCASCENPCCPKK